MSIPREKIFSELRTLALVAGFFAAIAVTLAMFEFTLLACIVAVFGVLACGERLIRVFGWMRL